jgi:hypothetical protein
MLGDELASQSVRLPNRLGRTLYDRFNALSDKGRIEYLEPDDVDALLQGTEQGCYQIGRFTAGPLGVLKSEEDRFVPPTRSIPLWHCADPGCQYLHDVTLIRHKHPAYALADVIAKTAVASEGPKSNWGTVISRMKRESAGISNKEYYDLPVFLADGLSPGERSLLVVDAFKGRSGKVLWSALKT